eukprot:GHVP01040007.1.p1 GENE.GHVP01040007.1~~GHVP01040007.1.p1  ORF type:complete len:132 (-),score=35.59 GHVP01040007.1:73-468(-)
MEILKKFTDEAYSAVSGPNSFHEGYAIDDPLFNGPGAIRQTNPNSFSMFRGVKRPLAPPPNESSVTDDAITDDEPTTEDAITEDTDQWKEILQEADEISAEFAKLTERAKNLTAKGVVAIEAHKFGKIDTT